MWHTMALTRDGGHSIQLYTMSVVCLGTSFCLHTCVLSVHLDRKGAECIGWGLGFPEDVQTLNFYIQLCSLYSCTKVVQLYRVY